MSSDDRRWRAQRESRGGACEPPPHVPQRVTFNRLELDRHPEPYGRMVADGEWRDYVIDFMKDRAVFSMFRRASEVPMYRIEKDPQLCAQAGRLQRRDRSGA